MKKFKDLPIELKVLIIVYAISATCLLALIAGGIIYALYPGIYD